MTGDGQLVELAATAQYRLDAARPDALRAYAFGDRPTPTGRCGRWPSRRCARSSAGRPLDGC